jgi:predicted nucleic acid-binding protein
VRTTSTPSRAALVPPKQLVLETSFVVDALIPSQVRHSKCEGFLENIGRVRSKVFVNRFLELELWEATYRIALRERHPKKRPPGARSSRAVLRRANALRDEVDTAWHDVLSALERVVVVDLAEVQERVPNLMRHGLTSYDAVHAATAEYADVRPFVTLDYHFAAVPECDLQLWVPASRVRPCREKAQRACLIPTWTAAYVTTSTNSPLCSSFRISFRRPSGIVSSLITVLPSCSRRLRAMRSTPVPRQSSSCTGSQARLAADR